MGGLNKKKYHQYNKVICVCVTEEFFGKQGRSCLFVCLFVFVGTMPWCHQGALECWKVSPGRDFQLCCAHPATDIGLAMMDP